MAGKVQSMNYDHSVVLVFQNSDGCLGSVTELNWRHMLQDVLGERVRAEGIGMCDGGGQGFGQIEIFFYVSDLNSAIEILKDELAQRELLSFAVIKSLGRDGDAHITEWDGPAGAAE